MSHGPTALQALLLNIFVPSIKWETSETTLQELIKAVVGVLDVAAMLFVLKQNLLGAASPVVKGLVLAIGACARAWKSHEHVAGWVLPSLVGDVPRMWSGFGPQRDWAYIVHAIDANLQLVMCCHCTAAADGCSCWRSARRPR